MTTDNQNPSQQPNFLPITDDPLYPANRLYRLAKIKQALEFEQQLALTAFNEANDELDSMNEAVATQEKLVDDLSTVTDQFGNAIDNLEDIIARDEIEASQANDPDKN